MQFQKRYYQCIHWLDLFWDEVEDTEDTIESHEKHRANGLVYQFNGQKSTQLKNIPKELLKRNWVENK